MQLKRHCTGSARMVTGGGHAGCKPNGRGQPPIDGGRPLMIPHRHQHEADNGSGPTPARRATEHLPWVLTHGPEIFSKHLSPEGDTITPQSSIRSLVCVARWAQLPARRADPRADARGRYPVAFRADVRTPLVDWRYTRGSAVVRGRCRRTLPVGGAAQPTSGYRPYNQPAIFESEVRSDSESRANHSSNRRLERSKPSAVSETDFAYPPGCRSCRSRTVGSTHPNRGPSTHDRDHTSSAATGPRRRRRCDEYLPGIRRAA